ncbi:MAG: bifunctional oligoribonuclease and phosphatase NrnA [Tenuifilum sp.]|nr:bifunctional oligoribonuclease and phosphatase NrnA [Tenuifilum sp.]
MNSMTLRIEQNLLELLKEELTQAKKIILTSHYNPDGDAIGSVLGLYHVLKQQGLNAAMVSPNDFPTFLSWLPDASNILIFSKDKLRVEQTFREADLVICLDFNGYKRVEGMSYLLEETKAKRVLIDHHPEPESPFDIKFSFTEVSSTAELVYEIASQLFGDNAINYNSAVSIFTGIMTDTGSFSYACSRERTFEIAGKLIAKGIKVEDIQSNVYNNFSENRMKLLGFSLAERMKVFPEFKAAYIWLTKNDLKKFKYQIGDTEGFVNYPLSINGINFSVLFTENDSYVKVSLRSRGNFPANEFSKKYYNGGGHKNAAGGKSFVSMDETLKQFEELLKIHSNELNA